MRRVIRIFKIALGIVLVGVVGLAVAAIVLDEPRPEGVEGPEADALAKKAMAAAHVDAWNASVGAIRWDFGGRQQHLWDRQRNLARVEWKGHVALLDLSSEAAHITKDGQVLEGEALAEARTAAYASWVNDSFWLNPLAKLFDEGTSRSLVKLDSGKSGLLISYAQGGVTPGDAYLWMFGQDGLPTAWRLWVDIIPIGGLEVSWEDWKTLPGGAKVSTRHEGPFTLELTQIESATTAAALEGGEDPFAALLGTQPARAASRPAPAPPDAASKPAPDAPPAEGATKPSSAPAAAPEAAPAAKPAPKAPAAKTPTPAEEL